MRRVTNVEKISATLLSRPFKIQRYRYMTLKQTRVLSCFCTLLFTAATLVCSQHTVAKDPPISKKVYDFTAGDVLPKDASHDWTLGPTGARGWCQVGKGLASAGSTGPSRQILITSVAKGTPADGVLQKGDVIVGIGGKKFKQDARITFAKTIGTVESSDGKMVLQRSRDGKTSEVTIELPKLPMFSDTAPYECKKSEILLKQGCDALAKRGLKRTDIANHLNAMALLASGDEAYAKLVKNYAHRVIKKPLSAQMSLPCWHFGFTNLFLCEYYLATKDEKVLPEITRLTKYLVAGRGPLSTWGHSFVDPENERLRGYGAVNAIGVPVVMSLALAKECGVKVKDLDQTLTDSSKFFRRHVGLGTIPYGDGPPTIQFGHDDNGKNSASALLFNLLGEEEATKYYARTAMAAFGSDREQGHTGNFFNMMWSMPAVALGGPDSTGMWVKEFGWYYDLARDPQHRYRYQGYPNEKKNAPHARWDCPGAYLLHFALPKKQLRITGREPACISQFTSQENKENIRAARTDYWRASPKELTETLASWSPVARSRAEKEMRKRKLLKSGNVAGLSDSDVLQRIAAVSSQSNFEACEKMLEDPDLKVRLAAMDSLARLNRQRAVESLFGHIVEAKGESPVFTQKLIDKFFPLGSNPKKTGDLLLGIKDRKIALAGITKLLADQDALVSSRTAMGVGFLPRKEQLKLLPKINFAGNNPPAGNVMFVNGLRTTCADVMQKWNLEEGLDLSIELLTDNSWGRNARLPKATKTIVRYGGNAKSAIPKLEKASGTYDKGNKWKAMIDDTITKLKKAPAAKEKLKSISDL